MQIFRKAALKQVRVPEAAEAVTAANLVSFVGNPPFTADRLYTADAPAGVITGLAWTSMGGTVLCVFFCFWVNYLVVCGELGHVYYQLWLFVGVVRIFTNLCSCDSFSGSLRRRHLARAARRASPSLVSVF